MADCLYECLKEARLEKYHRNFVNGGLKHCEALLHLSMQEYPNYGVVSMEDRLKLFKLIQIVKSVQAEGLVCQHGKHIHAKQAVPQTGNNHYNPGKKQTNVIKLTNNIGRPVVVGRRQLPQAPQVLGQLDAPGLRRSASMRQVKQPDAPALRRSASMRPNNAQRRSSSATRVEYRQNSDSPIFHCRRHLKFTDSDLESTDDEDEQVAENHVRNNPTSHDNHINKQCNNNNYETMSSQKLEHPINSAGNTLKNSAISSENTIFTSQLNKDKHVITEPKVRTFNLATDVKQEVSPVEVPKHVIKNGLQASPFNPQAKKLSEQNTVKSSTGAVMVKVSPKKANALVAKQNVAPRKIVEQEKSEPHFKSGFMDDAKVLQSNLHTGSTGITNNVGLTNYSQQSIHISAFHSVQSSSQMQSIKQGENHHHPHQPGATTAASHVMPSSQSAIISSHNTVHTTTQSTMQPFQFNHFTPSAVLKSGQHSYYPSSQDQQPPVQNIYHGSGYNYGVQNGTKSNSNTQVANDKNMGNNRGYNSNVPLNNRISVCVRKRPLLSHEAQRGEVDIVRTQPGSNVVAVEECKQTLDLSKFIQQHFFTFDAVFGASCGNESIYTRAVKPLVQCAFNKSAATCFAFGQTGSGKSHTLLGNPQTPGLYQLAAADIFSGFSVCKSSANMHLHLWVSYYEIYCSQLFDLLNKRKKLQVRENSRGKVCIAGLMETEVKNVKGLIEVVQYGNAVRSTGISGTNSQSSRSHAILQLEVRDHKDVKQGRMSFIDLAGSERATDMPEADRQTRLEGAEINQSLLALKECIRSIDQDSSHTPYRQSKLTHILRDSFLGNSRTVMIANVSPCFSACENTLNTLRYADRVKELDSGAQRSSPTKAKNNAAQTKLAKPATPKHIQSDKALAVPKTKTPQERKIQHQILLKEPEKPPSAQGPVTVTKETPSTQTMKPPGTSGNIANQAVVPLQAAGTHQIQETHKPGHTQPAQEIKHSIGAQSNVNHARNPFLPSNIMYASTPKRGENTAEKRDVAGLGSPFDVSKILKDEPETPERGHKVQKNKVLEESPEIIPAGKRISDSARPQSINKQTIVEDILTSDSASSSGQGQSRPKVSQVRKETSQGTVTNSRGNLKSDSSVKSSHLNGTSEKSNSNDEHDKLSHKELLKTAEIHIGAVANERNHLQSDVSKHIHVDTSRVNELVKQQKDALTHKTDRSESHSNPQRTSHSPTQSRSDFHNRGRPELRGSGSQTERISRSPNYRSLDTRSKSIESLRASLRNNEHSKSTPYLNEMQSDERPSRSNFETARHRSRSIESVRSSQGYESKKAWSPRSNHAQLRSEMTSSQNSNKEAISVTSENKVALSRTVSSEGQGKATNGIKSHDEIVAEHREVLDHLDNLLDRAKAAVDSPPRRTSEANTERPLKSILKKSGHGRSTEDVNHASGKQPSPSHAVPRSPKLNRKEHTPMIQNMMKTPEVGLTDAKNSRLSDPINGSLGPDVRPKEYPQRHSLSMQKTPTSRPPSTEEFLRNLADIKMNQHRSSLGSSGNRSGSSSRGNTPGASHNSGHSSAARTPSSGLSNAALGSGFVTPAATGTLIGYVSGNDVVLITDEDPAFTGSPLPVRGYIPPPAPRKTTSVVNKANNDIGFKAELERMEQCDSDTCSVKGNRSWHDILSDDDACVSKDLKRRVSRQGSREGSLEIMNEGVRQVASIRDADTVVIETYMESQQGRSTVDSGIGTHRDQSDPDGVERRTSSRESQYSLDLHSDHDTADDGISLSTDQAGDGITVPIDSTTSVHNQVLGKGDVKPRRANKSMPLRKIEPDEEEKEMYIPPLKLNFDEDDDDILEESYCSLVAEKRREAEEKASKKAALHAHEPSAFRAVGDGASVPEATNRANLQESKLSATNESQPSNRQTQKGPGSEFSPIQAFPITPRDDQCVVNAPTAHKVNNEKPAHSKVTSVPMAMQRDALSNARSDEVNRREAQQVGGAAAKPHAETNALTPLQLQLLASHEEQLAQMTALCKHEMQLLMSSRSNTMDFNAYVRGLEEILSDKGRCILHLKSKIDGYLQKTHKQ